MVVVLGWLGEVVPVVSFDLGSAPLLVMAVVMLWGLVSWYTMPMSRYALVGLSLVILVMNLHWIVCSVPV